MQENSICILQDIIPVMNSCSHVYKMAKVMAQRYVHYCADQALFTSLQSIFFTYIDHIILKMHY